MEYDLGHGAHSWRCPSPRDLVALSLRPKTPCPSSLSPWDAGSSLCAPRPPALSLAPRDVLSSLPRPGLLCALSAPGRPVLSLCVPGRLGLAPRGPGTPCPLSLRIGTPCPRSPRPRPPYPPRSEATGQPRPQSKENPGLQRHVDSPELGPEGGEGGTAQGAGQKEQSSCGWDRCLGCRELGRGLGPRRRGRPAALTFRFGPRAPPSSAWPMLSPALWSGRECFV